MSTACRNCGMSRTACQVVDGCCQYCLHDEPVDVNATDPAEWTPPTNLKFTCDLCGGELLGLEGIAEHLETEHGYTSERRPDGGLVLDTSALLDSDGGAS